MNSKIFIKTAYLKYIYIYKRSHAKLILENISSSYHFSTVLFLNKKKLFVNFILQINLEMNKRKIYFYYIYNLSVCVLFARMFHFFL